MLARCTIVGLLGSCFSVALCSISVQLSPVGTYQVNINEETWLSNGPTAVGLHADKLWFKNDDGSLKVIKQESFSGIDTLGSFTAGERLFWSSDGETVAMTTSVRTYPQLNAAVFKQSFPNGANYTNLVNVDATVSIFPSFGISGKPGTRGFLTFAGNMACPFGNEECTHSGEWKTNLSSPLPGGISGGVPLVLYDSTATTTLVMSPLTNFMSVSQSLNNATHTWDCGLMGGVTAIPAGFSAETVVVAGSQGVNAAMRQWGALLLKRHGKSTAARDTDYTIANLGFYTDNGAYYYYNRQPGKSAQGTLNDVKAYAVQQHIPYKYLQIDSWWYFKGVGGGVKNWTAPGSVFSQGLSRLRNSTQWPLMAHNRYWASDTDYARQNGGDYAFTLQPPLAIPTRQRFWDALFANATQWGLRVYEQDWLHNEFTRLEATMGSATLARQWLLNMGRAATQNDITIQYCMPYPRHILQSVEIQAVTQVRVSTDYHPGNDQWSIGVSSMLAHALALAPFKDNFWTTSSQPGSQWPGAFEPVPYLQAAVATLSTGPVGPSDGIGYTDTALVARTCRADGRLLKPHRPATAIDATFVFRAFAAYGGQGPDGELTSSSTALGPWRWFNVLAAHLQSAFALTPAHLLPSTAGATAAGAASAGAATPPPLVAFPDTRPQDARPFSAAHPIAFPPLNKTGAQLWHVAPLLPNGWALLGETAKFVPVSRVRISSLSLSSSSSAATGGSSAGLSLTLNGAPGEEVTLFFLQPSPSQQQQWAEQYGGGDGADDGSSDGGSSSGGYTVVSLTCTLGASGTILADMPAATCASA